MAARRCGNDQLAVSFLPAPRERAPTRSATIERTSPKAAPPGSCIAEIAMRHGKVGYFADVVGAPVCAAVLFLLQMADPSWIVRGEWATYFLLGIGFWTLAEYVIHRWIYHGVRPFMELHEAHHSEPHAYIGSPPLLGTALVFVVIYWPLSAFSATAASGTTAGVLLGYMAYQLVHHATHFWRPPRGSYLYRARQRHSLHHYHRELGNFGITTGAWDHVFGTVIEARRAGVPTNEV
jgi:sterol desaturase/sphingolipid hydroxylase (fatty acid hydroxylase superfamily)